MPLPTWTRHSLPDLYPSSRMTRENCWSSASYALPAASGISVMFYLGKREVIDLGPPLQQMRKHLPCPDLPCPVQQHSHDLFRTQNHFFQIAQQPQLSKGAKNNKSFQRIPASSFENAVTVPEKICFKKIPKTPEFQWITKNSSGIRDRWSGPDKGWPYLEEKLWPTKRQRSNAFEKVAKPAF